MEMNEEERCCNNCYGHGLTFLYGNHVGYICMDKDSEYCNQKITLEHTCEKWNGEE